MLKRNLFQARKRRHTRVREKISGSAARPRLCVFRSSNHIYVQLINDLEGCTIAAASTGDSALAEKVKGMKKSEAADLVGTLIAQRAIEHGIKQVVFDRGGYQYHGRVKILADAARKAGLEF